MTNPGLKRILDRDRTTNQREFAAWLIAEGGMSFKSKAAEEAFLTGAMLGASCYHVYQGEKRDAKRASAPNVRSVRRPAKKSAA